MSLLLNLEIRSSKQRTEKWYNSEIFVGLYLRHMYRFRLRFDTNKNTKRECLNINSYTDKSDFEISAEIFSVVMSHNSLSLFILFEIASISYPFHHHRCRLHCHNHWCRVIRLAFFFHRQTSHSNNAICVVLWHQQNGIESEKANR